VVAVIDCDEETVEITHDAERDESRCGVFCDGEPEVSFEAFGHTIHWCRECYEEPCGRCFKPIPEGTRGSTRAKGWCEDCREEVGLIVGDDERGIQKDEDSEQATLLTDGGRKTAYRPPCDAVENWSSRAPWDRIERRVCPICRYYFDTKATSGQVFCGDACRQRHERGEFL